MIDAVRNSLDTLYAADVIGDDPFLTKSLFLDGCTTEFSDTVGV